MQTLEVPFSDDAGHQLGHAWRDRHAHLTGERDGVVVEARLHVGGEPFLVAADVADEVGRERRQVQLGVRIDEAARDVVGLLQLVVPEIALDVEDVLGHPQAVGGVEATDAEVGPDRLRLPHQIVLARDELRRRDRLKVLDRDQQIGIPHLTAQAERRQRRRIRPAAPPAAWSSACIGNTATVGPPGSWTS